MLIQFNTTPVKVGKSLNYEPPQPAIENSFNLDCASLEDAIRYGGSITRDAISIMDLRHDKKYITVDTKVALLLPGMYPAIPGWHTDGVPRGLDRDPKGRGFPFLQAQVEEDITPPRYHLLVTGTHCPTLFMSNPHTFNLDVGLNKNLYRDMSQQAHDQMGTFDYFETEPSTVYEWDWWNVHTAQKATARGWRYLIRVTESDYVEPNVGANNFIRLQTQVYAPLDFGW